MPPALHTYKKKKQLFFIYIILIPFIQLNEYHHIWKFYCKHINRWWSIALPCVVFTDFDPNVQDSMVCLFKSVTGQTLIFEKASFIVNVWQTATNEHLQWPTLFILLLTFRLSFRAQCHNNCKMEHLTRNWSWIFLEFYFWFDTLCWSALQETFLRNKWLWRTMWQFVSC